MSQVNTEKSISSYSGPPYSSHAHLGLAISPDGHLYCYIPADNSTTMRDDLPPDQISDTLRGHFECGHSIGLLRLGILSFTTPLAPCVSFWQRFSKTYIVEICKLPELKDINGKSLAHIPPPKDFFPEMLEQAPFMRGAEYLNHDLLTTLWEELADALDHELTSFDGQLQAYLTHHNPAWSQVGKICFHLAENKNNPNFPFAFMATYATRSAATSAVQHLPLERALKESMKVGVEGQNNTNLLGLLLPVQRACEASPFIKNLVDSGAIFRPQAWKATEAHHFLKAIPLIEEAGIVVRVPNWWDPKKPPRPRVKVAIGNAEASAVGIDALLDFDMQFALPDGEQLSLEELMELINSPHNLVQIKGQWVEIDQEKLNTVLSHWQNLERKVKRGGLSFAEGLRLLAGSSSGNGDLSADEDIRQWTKIEEGQWLGEKLSQLRNPDQGGTHGIQTVLETHLHATLRPYQQHGVQWLWWLYTLKLGGCLADDMGLGKTIQILSLLLLSKNMTPGQGRPSILILPASLLGNWQAELLKFAPSLSIVVVHSSASNSELLTSETCPDLAGIDVVMTTYAYTHRLPWLDKVDWDMVIIDEAQAIKNPTAKQTKSIKKLKGQVRLALTGTPVENSLMDLWSLFDFVAPGLLGTAKNFATYSKRAGSNEPTASENNTVRALNDPVAPENNAVRVFYATVRHLVSPYILRRLKSDKSIIADLPDKTEVNTYCLLTKHQVVLYQKALKELTDKLKEKTEGIKRSGMVLSYLMRFKQICNHPDQWLGHGDYLGDHSGKFQRLQELCEEIASKQEKVLIFTQYREIIPAISRHLEGIFGRPGLILHGQTSIKDRAKLVEEFQQEQGPPFFVLSLKAGGTGLTLTRASHVIHFDRWWNPSVENQATDRAYRIGQKKNVLVHKFICQGTIEEKIDALIQGKKSMAEEILTKDSEVNLATMSDSELLEAVSLDIHRAMG